MKSGSGRKQKLLEIGKDTVYIRSNMEQYESEEMGTRWRYDEIQIPKDEYFEKQVEQNSNIVNTELTQEQEEALAYLNSTDWIVAKIGELQIQGEDTSELITKYSDVLAKREECRQLM